MSPVLIVAFVLAADPADSRPKELHEPVIGYAVRELSDAKELIAAAGGKAPGGKGLMISRIVPGSPADLAGLKAFDVIRFVNDKAVENPPDALPEGLGVGVGDDIELRVVPVTRSKAGRPTWGRAREVKLTVESRGAIGVSAMRRDRDPVEDVTWVRHRDAPDSVAKTNDLSLYFQLEGEKAKNLRLMIGYHGEDWIFMKEFAFRVGEQMHTIRVSHFKANRDVLLGNGVTEWIDLPIRQDAATALRAVSKPGDVILRLSGDAKAIDRNIDDGTRMMWHQTLDAYQWLGGVIDAEPKS